MKRWLFALALAAGCHLRAPDPCGRAQLAPGDHSFQLTSNGKSRSVLVRIPPNEMNRPMPLLIDLHGKGSNGAQERGLTGVAELTDARGWIAAHPDAIAGEWNAGECCGGEDDAAFVRDLIQGISQTACVDRARVYAMGMSLGGFFAERLACEEADRFTAVASVAAGLALRRCEPARPIPILEFHGTADPIVPIDGGGPFDANSARKTAADWTRRNGAAESIFVVIEGGGHVWPAGATERIVDFFSHHSLIKGP